MTVSCYRSIKLQKKSAEVVVSWVNGGKKRANRYGEQGLHAPTHTTRHNRREEV